MIEIKKIKDDITMPAQYSINNIIIDKEFLEKNNIIFIGYGGGGFLDKNKPWEIRFKNHCERFCDDKFLELFDKLNKNK